VLDDDSETMIGLVGKRIVPILVTNDGQPMLESMDMVAYVDGLGESVLTGRQRPEVGAWSDKVHDYFETMMDRIGYQPLPAV